MLNVYVLNNNRLITHHIYIYTLYLHYLYYLFIYTIFLFFHSIYSCLQFVLFMFSTLFIIILFCRTVFLTQCISLFVDKRVVLPLFSHNLIFSCPRYWDDDPAKDSITHEIKVYADNNDNNKNEKTYLKIKRLN